MLSIARQDEEHKLALEIKNSLSAYEARLQVMQYGMPF
jgi:predicted component of type VI protein secretion system